ncbi:MAG TPA: response regulator [Leptolyngbyaceae cyanobacterium]
MNSASVVSMTTKTILVIEDERNVRDIVQFCLEDLAGWNVLAVSSALEGLQRAALARPDAILLDISMPEMDGFMFLEVLRNNSQTQAIPVVLVSAKARWLDPQILQKYQVAGAIAKPFDVIGFPSQLAKLLGWNFIPLS